MKKIDACLWSKENKDGKRPIKIRITQNRKSKYKNVDYSILERYWNKRTKRVRENYPDHKEVNNLIETKLSSVIEQQTPIQSKINIKNEISFLDLFDYHIGILEKSKRIGDLRKHKTVKNHLLTFLKECYNKEDLLFNEINDFFLTDLKAFWDGKELVANTQNSYFKKIKHIYHQAIRNKRFIPTFDPFTNFDNPTKTANNKSLTLDEVVSLEVFNTFQYEVIEQMTPEQCYKLFQAKNIFLFSIYMRGIRISDLLFLKWSNINANSIKYTMRKTGKEVSIPINHKILYILRLFIPTIFKIRYFTVFKHYEDKEMFYSLDDKDRTFIANKLKNREYYNNFNQFSFNYDIKEYDKLEQIINHLSTNGEYKDQYIFDLLNDSQKKQIIESEKTNNKSLFYRVLLSATANYNKNLKLINKKVYTSDGQSITTNITSHLSRHTYTSIAISLGFDIHTISKSLGHRNLNQTQAYIKTLSTDFIDRENDRLFDEIGNNMIEHLKKTKNTKLIHKTKITGGKTIFGDFPKQKNK